MKVLKFRENICSHWRKLLAIQKLYWVEETDLWVHNDIYIKVFQIKSSWVWRKRFVHIEENTLQLKNYFDSKKCFFELKKLFFNCTVRVILKTFSWKCFFFFSLKKNILKTIFFLIQRNVSLNQRNCSVGAPCYLF